MRLSWFIDLRDALWLLKMFVYYVSHLMCWVVSKRFFFPPFNFNKQCRDVQFWWCPISSIDARKKKKKTFSISRFVRLLIFFVAAFGEDSSPKYLTTPIIVQAISAETVEIISTSTLRIERTTKMFFLCFYKNHSWDFPLSDKILMNSFTVKYTFGQCQLKTAKIHMPRQRQCICFV